MPIQLPTINDAHFQGMTVCGRLQTEDGDVIDRTFDDTQAQEYRSEVPCRNRRLIIGIFWGKRETRHIHVDIVDSKLYKNSKNERHVDLSDTLGRFDRVMGQQIDVTIFGRFLLPESSLPERGLINGMRFAAREGPVSFMMTGGELSIEGTPFRTSSWRIKPDGSVVVDLTAKEIYIITQDYLIRSCNLLNRGFNIFILGREGDAEL